MSGSSIIGKGALRKSLLKTRLAMAPHDRQTKSQAICAAMSRSINWSGVRYLHCFEPIGSNGEVNVGGFITGLEDSHPDVRIFTSRKIGGQWRVVTIDSGEIADPVPNFDAVIVPMLGFDERLHRIGYGGGYYDKFLAGQPRARKIGVCFEQGKVGPLPDEPHDVPLDMIITESRTYTP